MTNVLQYCGFRINDASIHESKCSAYETDTIEAEVIITPDSGWDGEWVYTEAAITGAMAGWYRSNDTKFNGTTTFIMPIPPEDIKKGTSYMGTVKLFTKDGTYIQTFHCDSI